MSEKWQPIETAPRNGTPILLALQEPFSTNLIDGWVPFGEVQVVFGWWDSDTWVVPFMDEGAADTYGNSTTFYLGQIRGLPSQPSHWRPLPSPPHKDNSNE